MLIGEKFYPFELFCNISNLSFNFSINCQEAKNRLSFQTVELKTSQPKLRMDLG